MIEENEFLERTRVKFAVFAKFQGDLCHAVWLTRGVDAEGVGLPFRYSNGGVDHWGKKKEHGREDQRKERQPGGISDSANAPTLPPFVDRALEEEAEGGESDQKEDAEIQHEFEAVIENVMPHLVRHHFADFRQGALFQKIIV